MISAKIQPIRKDLDVAIGAWLGPDARAQMLAGEAAEAFARTEAANDAAVGQHLKSATFVDGARSEVLNVVKPDGVIVRVYEVVPVLLSYIGKMLWDHSPVLRGRYQRSHRLLADGNEISAVTENWVVPQIPAGARELVFAPTVPYARKIDNVAAKKPFSSKAPEGVYHVVAVMAKPIIGGFGKISFGYRAITGMEESIVERGARPGAPRDMRQPALIISLN